MSPPLDIESLREDSGNLYPHSIRLKRDTSEEIDKFCRTLKIKKATLLRRLVEEGWTELKLSMEKKESDE